MAALRQRLTSATAEEAAEKGAAQRLGSMYVEDMSATHSRVF